MNVEPIVLFAEYQVRFERTQSRHRLSAALPALPHPRRIAPFARRVRSLPETFEVRRPYLEPLLKPSPAPAPSTGEHTPRAA